MGCKVDVTLKKVLRNYLQGVVGENGWELTKQIYADAYIQATDKTAEKLMPYVTGGEIVHAEVLKNTEELKEWVKNVT